jgi:hypothetical protein
LADRTERDEDGEETDEVPSARHRLKHAAIKLAAAVMGARGADEPTLEKVRAILDQARKDIYALLATDEG